MEIYDDAYYRNINRLESLLARHWPEVTQHLKLTSATLLELLIVFGGPDRVAAEGISRRYDVNEFEEDLQTLEELG